MEFYSCTLSSKQRAEKHSNQARKHRIQWKEVSAKEAEKEELVRLTDGKVAAAVLNGCEDHFIEKVEI